MPCPSFVTATFRRRKNKERSTKYAAQTSREMTDAPLTLKMRLSSNCLALKKRSLRKANQFHRNPRLPAQKPPLLNLQSLSWIKKSQSEPSSQPAISHTRSLWRNSWGTSTALLPTSAKRTSQPRKKSQSKHMQPKVLQSCSIRRP